MGYPFFFLYILCLTSKSNILVRYPCTALELDYTTTGHVNPVYNIGSMQECQQYVQGKSSLGAINQFNMKMFKYEFKSHF